MDDRHPTEGKGNIVRAVVGEGGTVPATLRQAGVGRVIGRRVIEWSDSLGTYGMGGPGFFGLYLAETEAYSAEWFALTLWGAGEWLLLDGRWAHANPNQYDVQRPLRSDYAGMEGWDEISGMLVGAIVRDAAIRDNASVMTLEQGEHTHILEVPEDTSRLPRYGGSLEQRVWHSHESHLDAWVISPTAELWV
ncbi:MAG TPA: hypothetical protein VGE45_18290 [Chloroflexia bacterium]